MQSIRLIKEQHYMNTNIKADYDLKKKLFHTTYDNDRPILNILLANKESCHKDHSTDYIPHTSKWDVEYYKCVQEIFSTVYGCPETVPKDIMNSFWHTYKFALQFYYPEYFRPNEFETNMLSTPTSEKIDGLSISFLPHKNNRTLDLKYAQYYQKMNQNLIKLNAETTWIDFLIANYDKFEKVHKHAAFQKFAQLTHTIGNIAIVPRGLNTSRSRYAFDYWDYTLLSLKDSFSTLDGELWKTYIHSYHLNSYVDENYEILPLWSTHFTSDGYMPQTEKEFNEFLHTVNAHIVKRGEKIMNAYTQLTK